MSLCDEGSIAIIPVDIKAKKSPSESSAYDVLTMRTGKILEWYPAHVKVKVYN